MAPQRDGYGRMTWVINGHDAMPVGAYDNLADAFREVEYLASLTIVAGP